MGRHPRLDSANRRRIHLADMELDELFASLPNYDDEAKLEVWPTAYRGYDLTIVVIAVPK